MLGGKTHEKCVNHVRVKLTAKIILKITKTKVRVCLKP